MICRFSVVVEDAERVAKVDGPVMNSTQGDCVQGYAGDSLSLSLPRLFSGRIRQDAVAPGLVTIAGLKRRFASVGRIQVTPFLQPDTIPWPVTLLQNR
jgi:hypothetical protein